MSSPEALQAAFASADSGGSRPTDAARPHLAVPLHAGSARPQSPAHSRRACGEHALLADHDGVISPSEAPIFFRQSGLPDDILSLVWQYSTAGNAYNAIVSPVCTPTPTEACAQCAGAQRSSPCSATASNDNPVLPDQDGPSRCSVWTATECCTQMMCRWYSSDDRNSVLAQGEFRVALHMCLDALQGRPLPASAPATPAAAAPPPPPITAADTDALIARFRVRFRAALPVFHHRLSAQTAY